MRILGIVVLATIAVAQTGSGVPGFKLWKASELKAIDAGIKVSGPMKIGGQSLAKFDNHSVSMSKREADGEAEVHEKVTDFFMGISGEATLVVGGKVKTPRTTGPGEIRGPSIEGGEKHTVGVGDVVHIPANVPHQLLVSKSFAYYVIKVDSK